MSEQQAANADDNEPDTTEPTPKRQAELRAAYEANVAAGKPPYENTVIRTLGEVRWIMRERGWVSDSSARGQAVIDLCAAILDGANLAGVELNCANFSGAQLIEVNLSNADLSNANFSGANLGTANLTHADLVGTNLSGTMLYHANLSGASLYRSRMDPGTTLDEVLWSPTTRLCDVIWNGAPLTQVDWRQVQRLGDEQDIRQAKNRRKRIAEYRYAARSYRGLSIALRSQGLLVTASNYRLREQVLERKAKLLEFSLLGWAFSWLLNLVAGYGERPVRSFIAYLLVILGFAAAFFTIDTGVLGIGGHEAINSPVSALVFSVTSFHGRGFFPGGGLALDDPITILAALEAILGLFIEITFIATFTQRFFAR